MRIRVVGLNSSEVAEEVRAGRLEAGLVQLPIDDRELEVSPSVFDDEVVYVSRDPRHTALPVDVTTLAERPLILSEARWAHDDPLRVSLTAMAQREGIVLRPIVEVEFQTHALELAAQGVGDSMVSYHVGKSLIASRGLSDAPLAPPIREHYAVITRRNGAVSAATAEFMRLAQRVLQRVAAEPPFAVD